MRCTGTIYLPGSFPQAAVVLPKTRLDPRFYKLLRPTHGEEMRYSRLIECRLDITVTSPGGSFDAILLPPTTVVDSRYFSVLLGVQCMREI